LFLDFFHCVQGEAHFLFFFLSFSKHSTPKRLLGSIGFSFLHLIFILFF
jgi:hypothetical protein